MDEGNNNNTEVFVYTEGVVVPEDVVRVRVHPSVNIIGSHAFSFCTKLEEIELCEGILEIEEKAFCKCTSLKRINIPSTITAIHRGAFQFCYALEEVEFCNGLLEIRQYAFNYCTALKRISVPSTVTVIREDTFSDCDNLKEVELCDGLQVIEKQAFISCFKLKRLTIPNTVRSIGTLAFCHAYQLQYLQLPEGIENMGRYTFSHNRCPTLRIPPSLTRITSHFIGGCQSMFSIELSEDVTDIECTALQVYYHSLRNIAFPLNVQFVDIDEIEDEEAMSKVFDECTDLQQLYYGSDERLINILKRRFDNLPIHKMIYYQSYNKMTVEQLNEATTMKKRVLGSNLNPTGNLRDCLGMTPLHILACSTVQSIELFKVLVTKYPENLITKDKWRALPLLYAVWGDAPKEIVQFLVERYKSIHPKYELNWTNLVGQLCLGNAATSSIQMLLDVKQTFFPEQLIDWHTIILKATTSETPIVQGDVFVFLAKYSYLKRIDAIGIKQWRDDMNKVEIEKLMLIEKGTTDKPIRYTVSWTALPKRQAWLAGFNSKLAGYEARYQELKEATALLELTLWKNKITENSQENRHSKKRAKVEETDWRKECRINCGAHIVIEHVLPYLL